MFEAAGFTIGGAPTNDGALRSSGAGVVVWSQASIRSRPFLDAAQRVINAEKAVVASLIEPPPPDSIGNSLAFDLSHWDGDPNDPSLDPLFFAVDRLVNAARAGVGAGPARPSAFDEPPPRSAPPRTPPPRPTPAPPRITPAPAPAPAPSADALSGEAEHWRAIRDSQDPSAFMEYLTRYGPRGTFSEVAELRLQQLAAGAAPSRMPRTNARGAEPFAPQARRPEQPMRRPEAPVAPPMAAPRRAEAPTPRRARTQDQPSYDRSDLREPPSGGGGGGALRTFILIALLGALAVAAGLYFGGGIGQSNDGPAVESGVDETASAPPPSDGGTYGEPSNSVSFSDANEPSPIAPRTREPATPPRTTAPREPDRSSDRTQRAPNTSERAPAPTPRTSEPSSGSASAGGPVSLQPGGGSSSGAPNTADVRADPAPMPPFIAPTTAEPAVETPPRTVTAPAPGNVVFVQRPTPRRIAELYPQSALRRGVGGRVQLDCRVASDLSLACMIASESPADAGFGRAALAAAESYRARGTLSNGASAVGSRTRISVNFQAPQ
jgi:outer membrane biosynthesis protein TonB